MQSFLNPRRVVNGATLLLALLVLLLSGRDAWDAYRHGLEMQQTGRYFQLATRFIEASALQARERGLTALLLGLGAVRCSARRSSACALKVIVCGGSRCPRWSGCFSN